MRTRAILINVFLVVVVAYSQQLDQPSEVHPLVEPSEHGHETGLGNKKRCNELPKLQLDQFLGSIRNPKLLPSTLRRRHALDSLNPKPKNDDVVTLTNRFNDEEHSSGLSESQDRYYSVGSLGPGPKQDLVAKILDIPSTVQLERLVVLAKNKDVKTKVTTVVHPVVIDTAHVFTTNKGKPVQFDIELHDVKNNDKEFDVLTGQLNKELDAAIDTKKKMLGDSHLTPEEIDKIIEHVVEQQHKKVFLSSKVAEKVGQELDESKINKERKNQMNLEDDEEVGISNDVTTTMNPSTTLQSTKTTTDEDDDEDDAVLGHKKMKKMKKLKKKGHHNDQGYYRANEEEDLEDTQSAETVNPLVSQDDSLLGHKKGKKMKKLNKKGHHNDGYYRSNEEEEDVEDKQRESLVGQEEEEDDTVLGHKKMKKMKKHNKKGHHNDGYYRSNEEEEDVEDTKRESLVEQVGQEEEEDDTVLGHKKMKKMKKFKKKGHHDQGYDQGYYRTNENAEDFEEAKHPEPEEVVNTEDAVLGHKKKLKKGNKHGGNNYRNNGNEGNEESNELRVTVDTITSTTESDLPPQIFDDAEHVWETIEPSSNWRNNQPEQVQQQYQPQKQQQQYQPQKQQEYQPQKQQEHQPQKQQQYQPQEQYQPQQPYQQAGPPAKPQNYVPEVYHATIPPYQQPLPANQYQPSYQQEPKPYYEQPQAYPPPNYQMPFYQPPQEPEAAYGPQPEPEPMYQQEEDFPEYPPNFPPGDYYLGKTPENIPEDPKLKASWFENEYNKLKNILAESTKDIAQGGKIVDADKQKLIDQFTKVIENDLTDGHKLPQSEEKQLKERISQLVEDDLQAKDMKEAQPRMEKQLDDLEKMVEDDIKASEEHKDEDVDDSNARSHVDTTEQPKTTMNKIDELRSKLKQSLNNLKNPLMRTNKDKVLGTRMRVNADVEDLNEDSTTVKTTTSTKTTTKSPFDLKRVVDDLKIVPNYLLDKAGLMKSTTEGPKTTKANKHETLLGGTNNKQEIEDEDEPDIKIIDRIDETPKVEDKRTGITKTEDIDSIENPVIEDKREGGGKNEDTVGCSLESLEDGFRESATGKKETLLDKILHPHHQHKKGHQRSEGTIPTIPEIIKELEENLHLPTLPPFPSIGQLNNNPSNQRELVPHIQPMHEQSMQVNNGPPMMMPSEGQFRRPPPMQQFQDPRDFPQERFQMFPQSRMMPPQQQQQPLLGAPESPIEQQLNHFGKIVPEAVHDLQKRALDIHNRRVKRQKMYFVGDGIKLPLHMHKHKDGTMHLSVDLQKLCKCNAGKCDASAVQEPDFLALPAVSGQDDDFADAPLTLAAPLTDSEDVDDRSRVKRSPKFDHYDMVKLDSDENNDIKSPIRSADGGVENMDRLNKDLKEYYENEEKIQDSGLNPEEIDESVLKRIGLIENILYFLKGVSIENEPNPFIM